MLDIVKHITKDINSQQWTIQMSGFEFEEHVSSVIQYALSDLYTKGIKVERTKRTRDGGKDLIINSPVGFTLFNRHFCMKEKEQICIYLEFKSSQMHKIGLDKFSKNILLANNSPIDYFVLVTNSTITPHAYYVASRSADENGYNFCLIDQYLLRKFLNSQNALTGQCIEIKDVPELSASYQMSYGSRRGKPYIDLYLLLRNNVAKSQVCSFQLRSDRNWKLSETKFDVFLDASESHCRHIEISKEHFDGMNEVMVTLTLNGTKQNIVIDAGHADYDFKTPLVGSAHKAVISDIIANTRGNTGFLLVNLHGEAGIGKTRILEEVENELLQSGMEVCRFLCSDNRSGEGSRSFDEFIRKEFNKFNINNLEDMIHIPMHFKKYAIVIEDIHNSDKTLFDQLKFLAEIENINTPVTVVIAGRDDYTVYNKSYFSFLSWIEKSDAKLNNTKNYFIDKLADPECRNLIRAIITGTPEFVVGRIHKASENNPFYVSQFIEYLLETSLIYLINRNTVGIINVDTFSQKLYIPDSIEELLEKRYCNLINYQNGEKLQQFLLLLSFYGIEAPKEIYYGFFSDEKKYSEVEILFKNRFIMFSYNDNIVFNHENIYLFLRKKTLELKTTHLLSSLLIQNEDILLLYPKLRQAMVQFYMKNFYTCENLLKEPIAEINAINNVSSCNLTPQFAEVYETIYSLAIEFGDTKLQRKTLLSWMYVALHNYSTGKASEVFEATNNLIKDNHPQDEFLYLAARQLHAHFLLNSNRLPQAKKLLLELLAQERKNSEQFDDETRFDIFDRISSIYTQENHKTTAMIYNQLSNEVAKKLGDNKLLALSKIIEAKIVFYYDTQKAKMLMCDAKKYLEMSMVSRINCHNNLGILTADIILKHKKEPAYLLLDEGERLLKNAIDVEYPGAIIRAHYLLAVILYLSYDEGDELLQSKLHVEEGIEVSIRNGFSKFMPLFHSLLAIISTRGDATSEIIYKHYETMLQHMRHNNQLFLGALDFTNCNIILLTNYAIFLSEHGLESEMYRFLSEIKYYDNMVACDFKCDKSKTCYYTCLKNMEIFKENLSIVMKAKGHMLFLGKKHHYPIYDNYTKFYVPLGV